MLPVMKTSAIIGLALSLSSFAFAQGAADTPGLLGTRYVETQFSHIHYDNSSDFSLAVAFNQPLTSSFDVGLATSHTQEEGDDSQNYQTLGAYLAAHHDIGGFRVFARAGLNYEWWSVKNLWWYQTDVGFERALNDRLLFTAYASWQDFLTDTFLDSTFFGTAKLTYWATSDLALSASFAVLERSAVAYRFGVAFAF